MPSSLPVQLRELTKTLVKLSLSLIYCKPKPLLLQRKKQKCLRPSGSETRSENIQSPGIYIKPLTSWFTFPTKEQVLRVKDSRPSPQSLKSETLEVFFFFNSSLFLSNSTFTYLVQWLTQPNIKFYLFYHQNKYSKFTLFSQSPTN